MRYLPKIHNKQLLAKGKWLQLANLTFTDGLNRKRNWELTERVNSNGAVLIIAKLKNSDQLILVKQYRPPADKFIIEFPAGLIDDGETPEETAKRELFEETGYHGEIISVSQAAYNSPGMSGETVVTVVAEIDDHLFGDQPPASYQEDSEDIETILVPKSELQSFINRAITNDWGIDSKVIAFAAGCN